jgi:DNA-binding response OmpR family regulator
MQDTPTPDQLLAAVAAFLREQAMPQLQAQAAFHARVAANALDIVRRQLALAPAAEAAEAQRLRALLQADGSLSELNALLCERIARGELGLHTQALMDHLWRVTLDKLAVDQPGYASYRRHASPTPGDRA